MNTSSYCISELLSLDGIILHITADYQTEHLVCCPASILACDDTKLNELSELIASVYNWDSDRPSFTEASSESIEIEFGEAILKLGIAPAVRQFLMGEITSIHEGKLDVSYRCLCDGGSPLHHAVERGWKELVDALIRNGADLDAKDKNERTPLHRLCFDHLYSESSLAIADLLLGAGCNPNALDFQGCSPLFVGKRTGANESLLRHLLLRGAKSIPYSEPPLQLPERVEARTDSDARLLEAMKFSFEFLGHDKRNSGKVLLRDNRQRQYWCLAVDMAGFPENSPLWIATKIGIEAAESEFGSIESV